MGENLESQYNQQAQALLGGKTSYCDDQLHLSQSNQELCGFYL